MYMAAFNNPASRGAPSLQTSVPSISSRRHNVHMNDPIQWGRSELSWSPPANYELTLTIWLAERASALFEQQLAASLASFDELSDAGASYEFRGGTLTRDERGTNAEPAILTITADRTLFAVKPARLLEVLGGLAAECRREASEQQERDDEIAKDWLRELHELLREDQPG